MDNLVSFEIVTPMGVIYQGEVKSVTLSGNEGEFGILRGHATLVSSLKSGVIDTERADLNYELVAIDTGHTKVDEDKINVLARGAVWISSFSENEIKKNLESVKELIKSMSLDNTALAAAFSKLDNAKAR